MQQYYSESSIALNYLCCYAKINKTTEGVIFYNTVLDVSAKLYGDWDKINALLIDLRHGIDSDSLIEKLNDFSSSGRELYLFMLQNGFIE